MDKISASAGETTTAATVATVAPYVYNEPLKTTTNTETHQHQHHQHQQLLLQQQQHERQQYYQNYAYNSNNVVSQIHNSTTSAMQHQQHYNAFNVYAADNYHNSPQVPNINYDKSAAATIEAGESIKLRHAQQQHQQLHQQQQHPQQQQHQQQQHISSNNSGSSNSLFKTTETAQAAIKPKATATAFYAQPLHTTTIAPAVNTAVAATSGYYDAYKYAKMSAKMPTATDYTNYTTPYTNIGYQQQQQQYYAAAKTQLQHDANYATKQMLQQQVNSFQHAGQSLAYNNNICSNNGMSINNNNNNNNSNTFFDKYMHTTTTNTALANNGVYSQTAPTHLTYPPTPRFSPELSAAAVAAPPSSLHTATEMYRKPNHNWHWNMDYSAAKSHCHSGIPTAAIAPTNTNTAAFLASQHTAQSTQLPATHDPIYSKYDKYNAYYQHQQYIPSAPPTTAMPTQRSPWSSSNSPHAHLAMFSERHLPPPHGSPHAHHTALPPHPAAYSHQLTPTANIRQNCCPQTPYQQSNQQACYYPRTTHTTYSPPFLQQPHFMDNNGNKLTDYTADYPQYANKVKYTNDLCGAAAPPYFHGTATASQQRLSPTASPASINAQPHYYSTDLTMQAPLDNYMHTPNTPNMLRQHVDVTHTPHMPYTTQQAKANHLDYHKQNNVVGYLEGTSTHKPNENYDSFNALVCGSPYASSNSAEQDSETREKLSAATTTTAKNISIRDFLASWNDDEEDYANTDGLNFSMECAEADDAEVNLQIPAIEADQRTPIYEADCVTQAIPQPESLATTEAIGNSLKSDAIYDKPNQNLPDIIVDIAKPNNILGNLENFDVEKELDELQNRKTKLNNDKDKDSPTENIDTNEAFELLTEKSMENTLKDLIMKTINTNANETAVQAATALNCNANMQNTEQFLKDIQINDSSSNHSNESTFEKEYETFINKICSGQEATKQVDVSNVSEELTANEQATMSENIADEEKPCKGELNEQKCVKNQPETNPVTFIQTKDTAADPEKENLSTAAHNKKEEDFENSTSDIAENAKNDVMNEQSQLNVRPALTTVSLIDNEQSLLVTHFEEESTSDVEKFSKFHKRKRKLIEDTKEPLIIPLKHKTKAQLKQTENMPNFPIAYTKKCRKKKNSIRTLYHKPHNSLHYKSKSSRRNLCSLTHYYKTLQTLRRYNCMKSNKTSHIQQILAGKRDHHLPLIKRSSVKNYTQSVVFNPKSLKCLSVAIINSEAFRYNLLCIESSQKNKPFLPSICTLNRRYPISQLASRTKINKLLHKVNSFNDCSIHGNSSISAGQSFGIASPEKTESVTVCTEYKNFDLTNVSFDTTLLESRLSADHSDSQQSISDTESVVQNEKMTKQTDGFMEEAPSETLQSEEARYDNEKVQQSLSETSTSRSEDFTELCASKSNDEGASPIETAQQDITDNKSEEKSNAFSEEFHSKSKQSAHSSTDSDNGQVNFSDKSAKKSIAFTKKLQNFEQSSSDNKIDQESFPAASPERINAITAKYESKTKQIEEIGSDTENVQQSIPEISVLDFKHEDSSPDTTDQQNFTDRSNNAFTENSHSKSNQFEGSSTNSDTPKVNLSDINAERSNVVTEKLHSEFTHFEESSFDNENVHESFSITNPERFNANTANSHSQAELFEATAQQNIPDRSAEIIDTFTEAFTSEAQLLEPSRFNNATAQQSFHKTCSEKYIGFIEKLNSVSKNFKESSSDNDNAQQCFPDTNMEENIAFTKKFCSESKLCEASSSDSYNARQSFSDTTAERNSVFIENSRSVSKESSGERSNTYIEKYHSELEHSNDSSSVKDNTQQSFPETNAKTVEKSHSESKQFGESSFDNVAAQQNISDMSLEESNSPFETCLSETKQSDNNSTNNATALQSFPTRIAEKRNITTETSLQENSAQSQDSSFNNDTEKKINKSKNIISYSEHTNFKKIKIGRYERSLLYTENLDGSSSNLYNAQKNLSDVKAEESRNNSRECKIINKSDAFSESSLNEFSNDTNAECNDPVQSPQIRKIDLATTDELAEESQSNVVCYEKIVSEDAAVDLTTTAGVQRKRHLNSEPALNAEDSAANIEGFFVKKKLFKSDASQEYLTEDQTQPTIDTISSKKQQNALKIKCGLRKKKRSLNKRHKSTSAVNLEDNCFWTTENSNDNKILLKLTKRMTKSSKTSKEDFGSYKNEEKQDQQDLQPAPIITAEISDIIENSNETSENRLLSLEINKSALAEDFEQKTTFSSTIDDTFDSITSGSAAKSSLVELKTDNMKDENILDVFASPKNEAVAADSTELEQTPIKHITLQEDLDETSANGKVELEVIAERETSSDVNLVGKQDEETAIQVLHETETSKIENPATDSTDNRTKDQLRFFSSGTTDIASSCEASSVKLLSTQNQTELMTDLTTTSLEDGYALHGFGDIHNFEMDVKKKNPFNNFKLNLKLKESKTTAIASSPLAASEASTVHTDNSENSCSSISIKSDASDFNELAALEKELSQHHAKAMHLNVFTKRCDDDDDVVVVGDYDGLRKTENNFAKELQNLLKNDIDNDARKLLKQMLESDSEDEQDDSSQLEDVVKTVRLEDAGEISNSASKRHAIETASAADIVDLPLHANTTVTSVAHVKLDAGQVIPKLSDLCKIALNSSLNNKKFNVNKHKKDRVDNENVVPNDDEFFEEGVNVEIVKDTNETYIITAMLHDNSNSPNGELSVEEALAEMYRQAGVILSDTEDTNIDHDCNNDDGNDNKLAQDILLINLEEILVGNSDLYVLQCDMNENVLSVVAQQQQQQQEEVNEVTVTATADNIETVNENLIVNNNDNDNNDNKNDMNNDNDRVNTLQLIEILNANDDVDVDFNVDKHLEHTLLESGTQDTYTHTDAQAPKLDQTLAPTPTPTTYMDSNSTSQFDLPSIHHEEIVPDNYKAFEREQFFKYLQTKYVQRHLQKFYHANRILKKYKNKLLNYYKSNGKIKN